MLSASLLLASVGIVPLLTSNFTTLSRSLLKSAGRCAIQVSFLGSVLLQRIMGVTHPSYVLAWIFGVGLLAGQEAISRIQYTYPTMERNLYSSVLIGGFTVLSITRLVSIIPPTDPWYDPRTWISVAGMLFGNSLNASSLAGASITKQVVTNANNIELRLARGATITESIRPCIEESYRVALTPTINSLAATGVIHIPGMMSGQILAGQPPQQAALYQIMINFLIASTAAMTVQLIVQSTVRAVVCYGESRLRLETLTLKTTTTTTTKANNDNNNENNKSNWLTRIIHTFISRDDNNQPPPKKAALVDETESVVVEQELTESLNTSANSIAVTCSKLSPPNDDGPTFEDEEEQDCEEMMTAAAAVSTSTKDEESAVVTNNDNTNNTPRPRPRPRPVILEINQLFVSRPNVTINLTLREGDRVAISGRSGIGKSQVLRTIVGLEKISHTAAKDNSVGIVLMGDPLDLHDLPNFRRHVSLVPQNTAVLEGMPQESFNQILHFQSHQKRMSRQRPGAIHQSPGDIVSRWDLGPEVMNQPWSTLSGGQAQRVSLALCLALEPTVLLMDESLSALDPISAQLVEQTLIESNLPIIIVTHSEEQKQRFCTHELKLA